MMHCLPRVTLLGDKTGGGSGMPFMQELPCGWSVRYSAVVSVDRDKKHIEFGIEPDVKVSMDMGDVMKKKDTLIEQARTILRQKASEKPYPPS
jgi:C-terminal processing protease CtpA/Prc